MLVKVKRQDAPSTEAYYQAFDFGCSGRLTVAKVIDDLNYRDDLYDIEGEPARRIRWECSCMQQMCGSCAMVIDGRPGLACSTFVDTDAAAQLVLEPLSKFPVISDLVVDRSCIAESLKDAQMFLGKKGEVAEGELSSQYLAGRCMKCGLCLEVCPNYAGGEAATFYGFALANEAFLLASSSEDRVKELRLQYRKHFERGCSKSLACRDVCPAKAPTLSSMGYMNSFFLRRG